MLWKQKRKHPRVRLRRKLGDSRCGATLVEFAFVAPLMIVLTMGMMEFGRVIMVQQVLANVSREGARLASLPETSSSFVISEMSRELSKLSVFGGSITVSPSTIASVESGTPITVQVSVPAANVSWIPNPVFTSSAILSAQTTMRREGE